MFADPCLRVASWALLKNDDEDVFLVLKGEARGF
jgi:hypothetical protein